MPDHGNGLTKAPPLSVEHVTVELRMRIKRLEQLLAEERAASEALWNDRYDLGFDDGWQAGRDEALESTY